MGFFDLFKDPAEYEQVIQAQQAVDLADASDVATIVEIKRRPGFDLGFDLVCFTLYKHIHISSYLKGCILGLASVKSEKNEVCFTFQ